jgi:hypothetical protein
VEAGVGLHLEQRPVVFCALDEKSAARGDMHAKIGYSDFPRKHEPWIAAMREMFARKMRAS